MSYFKILVVTVIIANCNSFPSPRTDDLEGGVSSFVPLKKKNLPHPDGAGPLSFDVLKQHPRLAYIGSFNNVAYYIERELLTWTAAKAFCESLGMNMGALPTQSERDYIYETLPDSDGKVWTSAKTKYSSAWPRMYWHIGSSNSEVVSMPANWFYQTYSEDALVFEVRDSASTWPNRLGIYTIDSINKYYTLCTIYT